MKNYNVILLISAIALFISLGSWIKMIEIKEEVNILKTEKISGWGNE